MLTQTKSDCSKSVQNPLSNTGLNSQTVHNESLSVRVDWLQGTIRFKDLAELHEVIHFMEGYGKEKCVLHPERGRFVGKQWHNSGLGIGGSLILYNLPEQEPDGLGHAFLSFPAVVLSRLVARDIWRLALGLVNCWGFKPTRFDIALDDYSKSISYYQVQAALDSKNYTGFRKGFAGRNFDVSGKNAGFTCYLGKRSSSRFARFYDKDAESAGAIKSHRFETEFHDKLAQKALDDWLAIEPEDFEENSPILLAGLCIGWLDFVSRGTEKNVTRMEKLDWWEAFTQKVGMAVRHSVEALKTSYQRKREWFTRQVSVTLAMFKKVMGNQCFKQYLASELSDAEERFNEDHKAFIQVYGREGQEIEFDWQVCND